MTRNGWIRNPALWLYAVVLSAFGLSAACTDTTRPRYVPPEPDSTQSDTTKKQG